MIGVGCQHLPRRRRCLRCTNERRAAQAELERIAPVRTPVPPLRTVKVRAVAAHSIEIDVDGGGLDVHHDLVAAGMRVMKAPNGTGWLVPAVEGERAISALELAGFKIQAVL